MKLYEELPDSIEVNGVFYPIETDFRYWAKFEQIISDSEGNADELADLITVLFCESIPHDMTKAFNQLLWFYRIGKELEKSKEESTENREPAPRAYDLDVDAGEIYSLFLWESGLDLFDTPYLHWWKFKTLLSNAPSETSFARIVEIRTKDTSKMEKNEKKRWNELKRKFALEKEEPFASAKEMEDAYAEKIRKRMQRTDPP